MGASTLHNLLLRGPGVHGLKLGVVDDCLWQHGWLLVCLEWAVEASIRHSLGNEQATQNLYGQGNSNIYKGRILQDLQLQIARTFMTFIYFNDLNRHTSSLEASS